MSVHSKALSRGDVSSLSGLHHAARIEGRVLLWTSSAYGDLCVAGCQHEAGVQMETCGHAEGNSKTQAA